MHPRIFVEWNTGGYLNSESPDFQKSLKEMVAKYGPPDLVEYRTEYEG